MNLDRNGLEVLGRAECLRLLGSVKLGRLALSSGALPIILPVNFLLDNERVLIRTGSGTKLDAALRNAVVAFEVDDIDPFSHAGWSVALTGKAEEITDPGELRRIARLPLADWATNSGRVIAVSLDLISGRRISELSRAGMGHHEEG